MHLFRTYPKHIHIQCPSTCTSLSMGNVHVELDPLRPFKASMSNIFLLRSVKIQCLANCIFWLLVKQPEVLREPCPSIKWSRKKQDYWDKTRRLHATKHSRICFPRLYWSHFAPISTPSPSLAAFPLHRKIHPPWNPIILCISRLAANSSWQL